MNSPAFVFLTVVLSGADLSSLDPPKSSRVALRTTADGVQIYACQAAGTSFQWVFKAPEAALFDESGRQVGRHFAGPSWQSSDGSLVTGEVAAKADSPTAGAIPWLLLRARSHEGDGQFAHIRYVQRTETIGGAMPSSGCDAAHQGVEARMRYSARYTFYAEGPEETKP
jgi:hypothetical protein